ncbi:hypothetical protein NEOLEDRAFT_1136227 [Neolentinus lepideus HHB14362 ss-1]|uniref:Uncharacterized protein n=1 Tax=Neolentinus lepideus HHB14362 ss-1 TaxID=1314782 RepID=A0A165RFA1_9AGAM|nr:hypothetical protein NEOLEDRAFT_1136227 [Neolentinus lepideus HHB14362 ss-1]
MAEFQLTSKARHNPFLIPQPPANDTLKVKSTDIAIFKHFLNTSSSHLSAAMAPSKAAFTVFVDEACVADVAKSSATKSTSKGAVSTTSATTITALFTSNITTLSLFDAEAEKENIDPLTGLRAGAPVPKGKKRKAPLAPKTVKPLQAKAINASQELENEKKKKKPTKSTSKARTSKPRKPKASKSRSPSLPVVLEDHEDQPRVEEVDADTRCYELTVLPLADVTEAYEEGSPSKRRAIELPLTPSKVPQDRSLEPEIGDDFIPAEFELDMTPRIRGVSVEPEEPQSFSTPEKEKTYTYFTFSSPSKSAERYRLVRERSLTPEEAALEL